MDISVDATIVSQAAARSQFSHGFYGENVYRSNPVEYVRTSMDDGDHIEAMRHINTIVAVASSKNLTLTRVLHHAFSYPDKIQHKVFSDDVIKN